MPIADASHHTPEQNQFLELLSHGYQEQTTLNGVVDHDSLQRTAVICVGKHVVLTNTAFPNQVESGYGYVLATILSLSQACHQTQLFQTNIKVCMYLQSD